MITPSSSVKTELNVDGLKHLKQKLNRIRGSKVEWGFLGGEHSTADMSYAALAWLLETGRRSVSGSGWDIPPRPAFRQSIEEIALGSSLEQSLSGMLGHYLSPSSNVSSNAFLEATGKFLSQSYEESMVNWRFNGIAYNHNAPMTVALKGFDRPFVETGELTMNVEYKIY